jgi:hypothetical protein
LEVRRNLFNHKSKSAPDLGARTRTGWGNPHLQHQPLSPQTPHEANSGTSLATSRTPQHLLHSKRNHKTQNLPECANRRPSRNTEQPHPRALCRTPSSLTWPTRPPTNPTNRPPTRTHLFCPLRCPFGRSRAGAHAGGSKTEPARGRAKYMPVLGPRGASAPS